MGKTSLRSSLRTFSSDVVVICFDDPGILGIGRNYISVVCSTTICSSIADWSIGTGRNSFVGNLRFWVYGDDNLEIRTDAITRRSGGRGDRLGNGLNRVGNVGKCLRDRSLSS